MKTVAPNLWVGMIAFCVTFAAAFSQNVLSVSLMRGLYAFVVFFALTGPVRWGLRRLFGPAGSEFGGGDVDSAKTDGGSHSHRTPADSESAPDSAASGDATVADFAPLVISRIERHQQAVNPEEVAHAIRRLTDE